MINISETAREELEAYFEGKEKSPIRIFLSSGGCCGMRLSMALDEPSDEDNLFEQGGFSFVVSKELLEATGKMSIEMTPGGFSIESENPVVMEGGGCGGCSSAGACGA